MFTILHPKKGASVGLALMRFYFIISRVNEETADKINHLRCGVLKISLRNGFFSLLNMETNDEVIAGV